MNETLKRINEYGLIPMIAIDDAKDAVPLAQALTDGGLPVAEITFRTAAAEESIKRIASSLPAMLLGAGTVLTVDQAERAIKAGAKYIVSPGFSPAVVKFCQGQNIPITPGVVTPTEIQTALDHGVDVVKYFPADVFGGIKTIKALAAPFGAVRFIPTGGVTTLNLPEFILFDKIFAVGGSWLAKKETIQSGKFAEITKLAREAIDVMLGFDLGHIGMNSPDANASLSIAKQLTSIFNIPLKEGNSSNFAGKGFEVNKAPGLGAHGHIAVTTNTIGRAIAALERKGVKVDLTTAKKDAAGAMIAVYLKDEVNGYAIHLLQKK
ncbi:MAG: bifunctional 4-hydroxy-2-oxoglutarate aldolase/2-dehydro-3-deoxy-phosphogluconate aldolase [Lentisphaerae bacterium]|nr:bifunctional 4-hydroxy-2-oxoglutarate aldolase/2-dehydro-3-deoxy-phosphogluconate aldolase [Lentisphaerota bacterium]